MSDASGLTVWNYDIRGRVTSEAKEFTAPVQYVTSYTYNAADLPVTMTYPDGEVVTFTYNNQMLLDSVAGTDTYVFDTQYDSASRMTSRELGNGLVQTYDYYAWNVQGGRLENLSTESLQNFTYQYDAVGNIDSISDSVNSQTQTFDYDALDRLITAGATGTTEQGGYATETYGYDSTTGNLSTKAGVTYTYDVTHKHAVASLSNGNSYSYDANGNMTQRNADGKSFTFAYDAENRLVSVSGDATATFTFNGDGQRVKSVMDGETTLFVGGHYEITNPGAGQTVTKYYMAGATRVAVRKGGALSYLLADHLGSTSLSTDSAGNRTSELRYKPWGETRFSIGAMPTKYTFTGQFSYTDDPSTPGSEGFGLMYYNARWVDPQLGRFTQPDTEIPASQGTQAYDRYAYANNNPILFADPTGHEICLSFSCVLNAATNLATNVASNAHDVFAASLASTKVTKTGNVALSVGARGGVFTNTFGLKPGGNYNASTITSGVSTTLAKGALKNGNVLFTALVSFGDNMTSGEHEPFSQEFWTSVTVDTAVSALTTVAVAAGVGIVLGALGVVASPLLIAGIVIAGSMYVGYQLEEAGVNDALEDGLNQAIDTAEEYLEEEEDE